MIIRWISLVPSKMVKIFEAWEESSAYAEACVMPTGLLEGLPDGQAVAP
jgi:hypothetical protein